MNWSNDLTRILNVRYPIIQAPMFAVSTPEMVAAANRVGGLGSLSLGDLSADQCVEAISKTQKLTNKPFATNIFLNTIPTLSDAQKQQYSNAKSFIETLARQHELDVTLPNHQDITLTDYHDQIEAIIAQNCKIVSFTFGNLDTSSIRKLKDNDTVLIGTCTSAKEAWLLEQSGIDLICVQGLEAGGHRGSFADENIPQIGGISLLAQVYDTVHVPLIYAGGIYNSKTLKAVQTLGAQGFQIGTLLLASMESALQDFEKSRLCQVVESDIVLTKSFSGKYARGISNTFIKTLETSTHILPYPYQNKLTNELRKVAKACKNANFVSIWMGQSIPNFSTQSTSAIIENLIQEVEAN